MSFNPTHRNKSEYTTAKSQDGNAENTGEEASASNPFADFAGNASFTGKVSSYLARSTAGKTVATILGEISSLLNKIWLLSQSVKHKAYLIGDLE